MSRSSIFNFNTAQFSVSSLFSKAFWLVVAGLSLVELGLRFIIPAGEAPTGSWYNNHVKGQYQEFQKLDHIDLYFTGTSIASVNVPPAAFDAELKNFGLEMRSFNAGIAGPDYEGVATALKHQYWPEKSAKMVIILVSPTDINEANALVRDRSRGFIKSFLQPAYAAKTVDFLSHFWLFGYRKEIRAYPEKGWQFDPVDVREKGFTPLPNEQRGRYQWNYHIDRNGPVAQSLYDLVDWLCARDVKVLIAEGLNEPAEQQRVPANMRAEFEHILRELDAKTNVTFVDLKTIEPAPEDFVDQLHIHEQAAEAYARRLAKFLSEQGHLDGLNKRTNSVDDAFR